MVGSSCHLENFFDRIVEGYQKQKDLCLPCIKYRWFYWLKIIVFSQKPCQGNASWRKWISQEDSKKLITTQRHY